MVINWAQVVFFFFFLILTLIVKNTIKIEVSADLFLKEKAHAIFNGY